MEFENETENIEKYYSSDEEDGDKDNYSDSSDSEFSDTEVKKPIIKIGDAISDDEMEDNDNLDEADADKDSVSDNESVNEDNDSDTEYDIEVKEQPKRKPKVVQKTDSGSESDSDGSDDDDIDDEGYLQKFDKGINDNYLLRFHPECKTHNYDEILALTKVVYNSDNIIVDPLHRTIPILTKYERTRVLGQRAKQINDGAKPFIRVPENIIDGYLIAEMELAQKRIPFIIRRPLPSGGSEYWSLSDLELID